MVSARMKLYKYRDFSDPNEKEFQRLSKILRDQLFWCARPEDLNDPDEFTWICDYTLSEDTAELVAQLLVQNRGRSLQEARDLALKWVSHGCVESGVKPIIEDMIKQCCSEIGLLCFGDAADNTCLWQRYGGGGAGVCVEIDVPARLLNTKLHRVIYPHEKSIHIDHLMRTFLNHERALKDFFSMALLSKPPCWSSEAEIRFISRRQNVMVPIDESQISALIFGAHLDNTVRRRIEEIVTSLSYPLKLVETPGRPSS